MLLNGLRIPMLATGLLASLSACGLPSSAAIAEEPLADSPSDPPALLEKTKAPPKAPKNLLSTNFYSGIISEIGADWVELSPGWKFAPCGREGFPEGVLQGDPKKSKRLSAAGTAVEGKWLPGTWPEAPWVPDTYFLSDVHVGDVVIVCVGRLKNGQEWATAILITRRPGGKIPPHPPDRDGDRSTRLSDEYQAYQDWEEKGRPIPKKYLDKDGRCSETKPPYPPVAPQPRVKK